MSSNYTKPNDPDHEDKPQDWLFGALLFTRTLGLVLPENHGVIIDLVGDMIELYPQASRVIVANQDDQIVVIDADDRVDLNEGDLVLIINDNPN